MNIFHRWRGVKKTKSKFDRLEPAYRAAIIRGLTAVGLLLESGIKRVIQKGPKTGRRYGRHQASAPGESPATDTGTLVRNVTHRVNKDNLSTEAWIATKYAKFLELGTRFMAPRPHLKKTLDQNRRQIARILRSYLKGARK